ncbi:MAG TPA: hypothetical protein VLA34_05065, partial [Candidatus Krumholzibacterium sp.]|nr:hypothetical protein [Candidatus Krumholzibacterium sp.]
MRPKILVIFLVLISVSILHSCGEDGNSPSDDGFSIDLTVVGTDGSPMGNLVISRLDHLDFLYLAGDTPQPMTMEIAKAPVSM